jgi:hypothetical protein
LVSFASSIRRLGAALQQLRKRHTDQLVNLECELATRDAIATLDHRQRRLGDPEPAGEHDLRHPCRREVGVDAGVGARHEGQTI